MRYSASSRCRPASNPALICGSNRCGGSYERANQGAERLRRDDLIRPCPLRTREEHEKASEGSDGTRGARDRDIHRA
jgi:hypothetical protein